MSEILDDFLFHGDWDDATDRGFLTKRNIKAIANGLLPLPSFLFSFFVLNNKKKKKVTTENDYDHSDLGIETAFFYIDDHAGEKDTMNTVLPRAVQFIGL